MLCQLLVGITLAGITVTTQANATALHPISYDTPNGETGTYTYHDDTYSGSGNKTLDLAPLTGGLGKLTDGTIATSSWYITPNLYVGWLYADPTINFHFGSNVTVNSLTIYTDEYFSVSQPSSVGITNGTSTFNSGLLTDKSVPTSYTFSGLNFTGKDLNLTLNRRPYPFISGYGYYTHSWIMLSEVTFNGANGTPNPNPVPEPLTILGAMTAVGFGASFKRKLAKNQKDKKS